MHALRCLACPALPGLPPAVLSSSHSKHKSHHQWAGTDAVSNNVRLEVLVPATRLKTQTHLPRAAACLHASGDGRSRLNKTWHRVHRAQADLPCVYARERVCRWRRSGLAAKNHCQLVPQPCNLHPTVQQDRTTTLGCLSKAAVTALGRVRYTNDLASNDTCSDAGVQGRW